MFLHFLDWSTHLRGCSCVNQQQQTLLQIQPVFSCKADTHPLYCTVHAYTFQSVVYIQRESQPVLLYNMEAVPKVIVINLKRRLDRLQEFLIRYPFNLDNLMVFEAVDGFDQGVYHYGLTRQLYERYKHLRNTRPVAPRLRYGEFGCLASHVGVYKMMVDQKIPKAVIFEDDVFFCEDFVSKWSEVMEALGDTAPEGPSGFLYLGGRFCNSHVMSVCKESGLCPSLVYHDFQGPWIGWEHDRTTHAYALNLPMAERLLDYFLEGDGVTAPVDHSLLNFMKGSGIAPLNTQPLLCYSPANYNTDIQGKDGQLP